MTHQQRAGTARSRPPFARPPVARYLYRICARSLHGRGQGAAPDSLLPYDEWTETAMRQVVVRAVSTPPPTACPASTISTSRSAPIIPAS